MYCKAGTYNCYGYDFKFFYPSIMASKEYMIPSKQGKYINIDVISKQFEYGIYNICVQSNNGLLMHTKSTLN